MDRLQKLERGWLLYKLRQSVKIVLILSVAVLIGGAAVYLVLQGTQALQQAPASVKEPAAKPAEPEQAQAPAKPSPAAPAPKAPVLLKLAPDYEFEREIERRVAPRPAAAVPTPPAASALSIARVGSLSALEAAFESQPTYAKAVEIAEGYLAEGNSAQALKWALKANEINNEDERSWAVFAAASNNLGRKDQAVGALKAYLAARPSQRLSQLLTRLEQP